MQSLVRIIITLLRRPSQDSKFSQIIFDCKDWRATFTARYTKSMATPVIVMASSNPRLLLFTVQYKAPKIYSKEVNMYINISP